MWLPDTWRRIKYRTLKQVKKAEEAFSPIDKAYYSNILFTILYGRGLSDPGYPIPESATLEQRRVAIEFIEDMQKTNNS
jgi:hypothetical protein